MSQILSAALYDRCACLPIIDYHGHLSPERIASNTPFGNLSELWIDSDHYKWRLMRIAGEADASPAGQLSPKEKFLCFVRALQNAPASPMQSWVRLELANTFGIHSALTPTTAEAIWQKTLDALRLPEYSPRAILTKANTRLICTTDDPTSTLAAHLAHKNDSTRQFEMLPSFRPDAAMCLGNAEKFNNWIGSLEISSDTDIINFGNFMDALRQRFITFHELGCRVSDHGIDHAYPASCNDAEARTIFLKLRTNQANDTELNRWRGRLMHEFAEWDTEYRWTMLLHLGARRNINRRIAAHLGLDAGCDAIGDFTQGEYLVRFLDNLDAEQHLPRTILFNSNPSDTLMFSTIAGSYFEEGIPGKVQVGPPWWFLDQRRGLEEYLDSICAVGLLALMPGMVADSRSFLSISRHDYFRRIVIERLCRDIDNGLIDLEQTNIDALCRSIFFDNAQNLFGWTSQ